jgi:hypothetical protein
MKRGTIKKREAQNVSIWIPLSWKPLLDQAITLEDSDQSKFIRLAIRERLERKGLTTGALK